MFCKSALEIRNQNWKFFCSLIFILCLIITISLFLKYYTIQLYRRELSVSIGLLFFPVLFNLSNFIQYCYGLQYIKKIVQYSFIVTIVILMLFVLLNYNYEKGYILSINNGLTLLVTVLFLWFSNIVNLALFNVMNGKIPLFFSLSVACLIAECLMSFFTVPVMMYRDHLNSNEILSIGFIVCYKVFSTLALSGVITVLIVNNNERKMTCL